MSKKPMNYSKTVCLAVLLGVMLGGCNVNKDSSSTNSQPQTSSHTQGNSSVSEVSSSIITSVSPIKSLTANESNVDMKIGEEILLSNYYTLEGNSALSASQKQCEYESSDTTIVEINGKKAVAVGAGEVTITIKSKADSTKTCSFDIKVSNVFIDRDLSMIPSEDDFSNEWNDDLGTGEFSTNSMITNYFYVRDVYAKNWYIESEFTIAAVNNDKYPKIGFITRTLNSKEEESLVAFYLDAAIGGVDGNQNITEWNNFGVCEVANGHWAWEPNIPNSIARHNDAAYIVPATQTVTYNTKFKMGVYRDDNEFHVYINEAYAYTYKLSESLEILYENGNTLESNVGFFHFNTNVKFSNYKVEKENLSKYSPAQVNYCTFAED